MTTKTDTWVLKYPIFDLQKGIRIFPGQPPDEAPVGETILCVTLGGRTYWIPNTYMERVNGISPD